MIVRSMCGMVLWSEVLRATTPPFIRYVTFRKTQGVTEGQIELEHFMALAALVPLRLARLTLSPGSYGVSKLVTLTPGTDLLLYEGTQHPATRTGTFQPCLPLSANTSSPGPLPISFATPSLVTS